MNTPVVVQAPGAVPGDVGVQSRLADMLLNRGDSPDGEEPAQTSSGIPLDSQQSNRLPPHSRLAVDYAQALLQLRVSEQTAPRLDEDRRRVSELNGIVVAQLEADGLIDRDNPSHVVIAYFEEHYHYFEFFRDPANGDAVVFSKSFEIINVDALLASNPVAG